MISQQPADREAVTGWAPKMTTPNIVLLCLLMLMLGWEARGVRDRSRFNDELDARLVHSIVFGIASGWLAPNWDAVDSAAEVEPTASLPSPAQPESGGHSSPQHQAVPVASTLDAWHPST